MFEEKFSCVKEINKTIHIPVPSICVSNEVVGITQILESYKRQYLPQLHGVIVDYKNVSLTYNAGHIVTDKPFVHYDVNATFSVFCPSVGSFAKGTIKRISRSHLGCLILNTINVTIHLTENLSYAKVNKFVALDSEIIFQISYFNFDSKIIRVNGEITEECISLMESLYPHATISANASGAKAESLTTNNSISKGNSFVQTSDESSSSSDDSSNSESHLEEKNALQLTSSDSMKSESTNIKQRKKSKHSRKDSLSVHKNNDGFVNDVRKEYENLSLKSKTPKKKGSNTKLLSTVEESKSDTKHKKKKQKHKNSSESVNLGDSFNTLFNEIKEEPNLDFLSPVDVLSKQKKRKRESSSSLDRSSVDLVQNEGHKKKKQKHKDSSQSINLGDSFSLLDEIKEEPNDDLFPSVDVHKQHKKKKKESSFDQSLLDFAHNEGPKRKKHKHKDSSDSVNFGNYQKEKEQESSSSFDQSSGLGQTPEKKKRNSTHKNTSKIDHSKKQKEKKRKKSSSPTKDKSDSIKKKKHKSKKSSTEKNLSANCFSKFEENEFSQVKEESSESSEKEKAESEKHNIQISGDFLKLMNSIEDEIMSKSEEKPKKHKRRSKKITDSVEKQSTKKRKHESLKDSTRKSSKKKTGKHKEK